MKARNWLVMVAALGMLVASQATYSATILTTAEIEAANLQAGRPRNCRNYKYKKWTCKDCAENVTRTPVLDESSGNPAAAGESCTTDGSIIDNISFNHIHKACDWRVPGGAAGCASCGVASGSGGIPVLGLERRHRFRDVTEQGSLGPGVFFNYDLSLQFYKLGIGNKAYLFDPDYPNRVSLVDGGHGDVKDGVYVDYLSNIVKELRLYSGPNGTGSLVTNIDLGVSAVVKTHAGNRYVFEMIDVSSAPTGWKTESPPGSSVTGSLSFDGVDDYVETGYNTNLATYTVSTWVKSPAAPAGGANSGPLHREKNYQINWNHGNAVFRGAAAMQVGGVWYAASFGPLSADTWYRLTASYDGAALKSYVNGTLVTSTPVTGTPASETATLKLGRHAVNAASVFKGQLQDARVYNRALTDAEVAAIDTVTDFIARWKMDEGTGTVANDSSGNARHGTLVGMNSDAAGRLVRIEDRNGYGVTVTYKTFTAAELLASPERQWQIDTAADANGRQLAFSYHPAQESGRWVVSQVALPNGQTVTYSYADGKLSQISHPDGTVSTFTFGVHAPSQSTTLEYADAAAEGTHRKKKVYLTNNFVEVEDAYAPTDEPSVYNQSSLLVRMVTNGAGEVSYYNESHPTDMGKWLIYEGAGKLKEFRSGREVQFFKDGWTFTAGQGYNSFAGAKEATFTKELNVAGAAGYAQYTKSTPQTVTDKHGRIHNFEYNPSGYVTKKTLPDATTEKRDYNAFNQPTRSEDRLGRVTRSTYDARGNPLTREEGILNIAGVDTNQPEYAIYQWEYFPAGHANQFLLSAAIDANTNRTEYVYNAAQFLIEIREPNDDGVGNHVAQSFTYDATGRLATSADALGRTVTYDHDPRDRVIKVTYFDGSTEETTFGTGPNANLVVQSKDRNGNTTTYAYDVHGRVTTTVTAANDPSVAVSRACTYLNGTNLLANCTTSGELTSYGYDYRHRNLAITVQPRVGVSLTSANTYTNNELTKTTDPYGRKSYNVYRASDGAQIRSVQGTVPADGVTDPATITRNLGPNAKYLVSDIILDVEGQVTKTIDPRGIEHTTSYDSRGRTVETIEAFGTADAAKTQTNYDAQSNTLQVKHPRTFDPADSYGGNFFTGMSYTARNLLKTRTEAVGRPEAATVQFTYNNDGTQATMVDARTNTWTTLWSPCCANRQTATLDPTGAGTSTEYDLYGNVTHTQVLQGMTVFNETTTRFDARHRPTMQTAWLVDPPAVDPQTPPIAGENGVPAANGLTTRYTYDDDLDDGIGLDATFAAHFTGLNLGAGSDGSASLVTNPEGERSLSIRDGLGRGVRTLQLDAVGSALNNLTTTYDAIVTVTGYGDVVETAATDALTHTNRSRSDAAGRTIESVDAENQKTVSTFDANGNRLSVRDPNGTGLDCIYDARNRDVTCTDTQGDPTAKTYDKHSNVTVATDAKLQNTVGVFDARDRRISSVDRISGLTQWTFDPNNNLLSLTDAETRVTSYEYDPRNLKIKETYPDHVAGQVAGDPEYGIVEFLYDGARRLVRRTDQLGDTCTSNFDRSSRLTSRDYRLRVNSPAGAIADSDTFTFDAASRMLTATSGRYSNVVAFAYDDASRRTSESLTIGGQTYTVASGFDTANRRTGLTYPDGSLVARSYTARDQLQQVDYNSSMVASFAYDLGSRETSRTFGNGLATTRTYRPDNLTATLDTPGVTSFSYAFDANKNKTSETIGGVMAPYGFTTGPTGYDDEDRLTAWNRSDSGFNQSWNLGLVGDWNTFTTNGTPQSRTHNVVHELTAIASSPLTYDAKGNLTQRHDGRTFVWDFDNRLKSTALGAVTVNFTSDALGRRVSKGIGIATTVFVSAGNQEIAEYLQGDHPALPLRKYAYGVYIDELLLMDAAGVKHFYHSNSLYSVTALTNGAGAVVERYAYQAYGQPVILAADGITPLAASAVGNPWFFTGRRLDLETGLYHYRERYFDADLGRFIGRDSIGYTAGMSLYSYVNSRPLVSIDPSGNLPGWDGRGPAVNPYGDWIAINPAASSNEVLTALRVCQEQENAKNELQIVVQAFIPAGRVKSPLGWFAGDTNRGKDATPGIADEDYRIRLHSKYDFTNGNYSHTTDAAATYEFADNIAGSPPIAVGQAVEGQGMNHKTWSWGGYRPNEIFFRLEGSGGNPLYTPVQQGWGVAGFRVPNPIAINPFIDYGFTMIYDSSANTIRIHTGRHDGFPSYEVFAKSRGGTWTNVYYHDALKTGQTPISLIGRGEFGVSNEPPTKL